MKTSQVESEIRVPSREWRSPASEKKLYAVTSTPVGEVRLYRQKSNSRAFETRAYSLENWEFTTNDTVIMTLDDAVAPGINLQARIRDGIHGRLAGETFRVHGATSVIPRKRAVRFDFEDRTIGFEMRGTAKILVVKSASVTRILATSRRGKWELAESALDESVILAFFVAADLEYFLESPLWNIMPI